MDGAGQDTTRPDVPSLPDELLNQLKKILTNDNAPFLRHLGKHLTLEWMDPSDRRFGVTRFEYNHHELFRRRRLRGAPGPITIALHPSLHGDEKLYRHTLVHELLHAAGLIEHDGNHAAIVSEIAPAPKLSESPTLQRMREEVLSSLPEKSWVCGECGHAWQRRRVSLPKRCPKCAKPFSQRAA